MGKATVSRFLANDLNGLNTVRGDGYSKSVKLDGNVKGH